MSTDPNDPTRPRWSRDTRLVAEYDYTDGEGNYIFTKVKGINLDGHKTFVTGVREQGDPDLIRRDRAENPDLYYKVESIRHLQKMDGSIPPVLYRLPEFRAQRDANPNEIAVICEGEKDTDNLRALGVNATTNAHGARHWDDQFNVEFADRDVAIMADNDPVGRARACRLWAALSSAARSIRVVDFADLPAGGDPSDFLDRCDTAETKRAALLGAMQKADPASPPDWLEPGIAQAEIRRLAKLDLVSYGRARSEAAKALGITTKLLDREVSAVRRARHGTGDGDDEISQVQMAGAWSARHGANRRFDHSRSRWMVCNTATGIWSTDESRAVFNEIGATVHELGQADPAFSNASFIRGVETLSAALPRVAVTQSAFDREPLLLGTPAGPVDLRTGKLLQPDPSLLITKSTSVAPQPGTPERYIDFLRQSTGDDVAMIEFLQRMWGYMLTGLTIEQSLFFIYGDGGNGKGVFINVGRRIMADYAVTSAMETFTASKHERHSTELAMLRGARSVLASETEQGKKWAESRIKQLTGNDEITARFMRQDNFTFTPEFKLLIIGNFHPALDTVDAAMRRRFNIIPFVQKPQKVNTRLEGDLEAEFPQILSWMIEGCIKWQSSGLQRPAAVAEATAEYFEEQDTFGRWLEEFCDLDPLYQSATSELYHNWKLFAEFVGEDAGTEKTFTGILNKKDFRSAGRASTGARARLRQGLKLKQVCQDHGNYRAKTPRDLEKQM